MVSRQLTEEEKLRWIAFANATPDVLDDVIRAKDSKDAAGLRRRLRAISLDFHRGPRPLVAPRLSLQHLCTFMFLRVRQ